MDYILGSAVVSFLWGLNVLSAFGANPKNLLALTNIKKNKKKNPPTLPVLYYQKKRTSGMRADKRDTATQNLSHTYSRLGMAGVVEGTQTAKRFVVHLSFDMWGVLLLRPCMLPIL